MEEERKGKGLTDLIECFEFEHEKPLENSGMCFLKILF